MTRVVVVSLHCLCDLFKSLWVSVTLLWSVHKAKLLKNNMSSGPVRFAGKQTVIDKTAQAQ
jgi:hypothetical protein